MTRVTVGSLRPSVQTSNRGTASEASQAQVNTGTADGVYVSPKTLAEKVEVITASGTDTYTATIPGTLTSGRRVYIKFTNANTGASTLNGTAIKKSVSTALSSGDILATEIKLLAYDGTNFQIVGGSGSGGSGDVTGPSSATADDIATYNGATGKIIKDGGSKISDLVPITRTVNSLALSGDIIVPDILSYRRTGGTRFYSNNVTIQNLTTVALAANTLRAYPFVVVVPMTLDRILSFVTSAVGSTTYRVGIYTDSNGYPDALVANSDTGTYDSGTGAQTNTGTPASNITLTPALYWIAFNSNGAPTLRAHPLISAMANVLGLDGTAAANAGSFGAGWTVAFTYAAMPDPFTAGGTTIAGAGVVCPVVQFRLT